MTSGESKGRYGHDPSRSSFFYFNAVFGKKIEKKYVGAPTSGVGTTARLENPQSATKPIGLDI